MDASERRVSGINFDRNGLARLGAIFAQGIPDLRLTSCTRWPERAGCGQECVEQIELTPEECMVRELLGKWFEGKSCIFCRKPFGEINWTEHKPALYDVKKQSTVEWGEIPPETLPIALETYLPVCWNCHIAESFRREHPELVVQRKGNPAAHV